MLEVHILANSYSMSNRFLQGDKMVAPLVKLKPRYVRNPSMFLFTNKSNKSEILG